MTKIEGFTPYIISFSSQETPTGVFAINYESHILGIKWNIFFIGIRFTHFQIRMLVFHRWNDSFLNPIKTFKMIFFCRFPAGIKNKFKFPYGVIAVANTTSDKVSLRIVNHISGSRKRKNCEFMFSRIKILNLFD